MRFSKKQDTQNFDDLPVDSVNYKPKSEIPKPIQLVQENTAKSRIGHKITLIGELSGTEDIIIDGKVEGNIKLEGHTVTIGKKGEVNSKIRGKTIVAEGNIKGDVEAQDLITLKNGSSIHGNLTSDRIQLDDGAKFWGGINVSKCHSIRSPQ